MKIYQIEVSSLCNLSCDYCPHKKMNRKKENMTYETFKKVIELTKICNQDRLYLHNMGEPLLNKQLAKFIKYACDNNITCTFFTNGIHLNKHKIMELYNVGLRELSISEHVKGTSSKIKMMIKELGLEDKLVFEDVYDTKKQHNWAMQTGNESDNHFESEGDCIFKRKNSFVILSDGRIASCCIDYEGVSSYLTIDDLLKEKTYKFKSFSLCENCNLMRAEEVL